MLLHHEEKGSAEHSSRYPLRILEEGQSNNKQFYVPQDGALLRYGGGVYCKSER
jgi:predicted transcriptional regulator